LIPFSGITNTPIDKRVEPFQLRSNRSHKILIGVADEDNPLMSEPTSWLTDVNFGLTLQKRQPKKVNRMTSI
tara:strand:- start:293 stop:508 length:216 start_codon:yes stop_codon:yes gene_type:complete